MHYNTIISQANDAGDPSITPLAIRKTPRWIMEQLPFAKPGTRRCQSRSDGDQENRLTSQPTLGAWVVFSGIHRHPL